jgi:large subunit ribosomal protein L15
MVVRRTKKVNKYRGDTTHGGGHRKKRRGAGSRGGRGNAGSGKRAGHKRQGKALGRNGFVPRRTPNVEAGVNLSYFTQKKVDELVASKKAVKEADVYVIDLKNLGFAKLLGTGMSEVKLKITVAKHTPKAAQKVAEVGGEIVVAA